MQMHVISGLAIPLLEVYPEDTRFIFFCAQVYIYKSVHWSIAYNSNEEKNNPKEII